VTTTEIVAGNHNDAYELTPYLHAAFQTMQRLALSVAGAFFNADSALDSPDARQVCFNHDRIPNIDDNKPNRNTTKRGRQRLCNPTVYKNRFTRERTVAWIDKFRARLGRSDIKIIYFMGSHFLALALIILPNVRS
jgi:hypothetical protein